MMQDNNKENNLVKYENTIFNKIKCFLKRLLKKEEVFVVEVSESNKEVLNIDNNMEVFRENIAFNDSGAELVKLQEQFENGKISENDLTEEQVQVLTELYDVQIEKLKESIEKCKKEILLIKKRLN